MLYWVKPLPDWLNKRSLRLWEKEAELSPCGLRWYLLCHLTPELSRTAARNGGVVHVTMQPSREAVSA